MDVETKVNIDDLAWRFGAYHVSIEYNPHKMVHQSIPEYFEGNEDNFIDYEECVKNNKVYEVRVYPDNSVAFYEICSSNHDDAVNKMIETLRNHRTLFKR